MKKYEVGSLLSISAHENNLFIITKIDEKEVTIVQQNNPEREFLFRAKDITQNSLITLE